MNEGEPILTIWCPTYNHESYIGQCLNGFVSQKTTFQIEILVHDDASTDKTAQVVREYELKYPNLFRCIYQSENQFSKDNGHLSKTMVNYSRGKYIAICEGDDYWADPHKLQKQVDFLESNEDFVLCFHKVKIQKEGNLVDDFITKVPGDETTISDLAEGNYIYPLSVVFRNIFKGGLPPWFVKCKVGDYPLFMLLAKHGKLKQLEDSMGVYRLNDSGIWYSQTWIFRHREWHKMLVYLISEMEGEIREKLQEKIFYYYAYLEREFEELEKKNKILESEYAVLENSFNNRLGKAILKGPRVLKKVISKKH